MKRIIRFMMAALTVCCLLLAAIPVSAGPVFGYNDLPEGHWAYNDVMAMTNAGIVKGVGNHHYAPQSKVTYAMFLTIIGRTAFESKVDHDSAADWYSPYVEVLDELGILTGTGIGPESMQEPISRYDMARVINNCLRYFEVEILPYDIEQIADYKQIPNQYAKDVCAVFSSGVIKGYSDNCFHGENSMNRAEMAAAANRFQTLLNQNRGLYQLTIETTEGGTIPAGLETEINGYYAEGAEISIIAREMPDYVFVQWKSSGGGVFGDQTMITTSFTMPAHDTVITAVFEPCAE